jgi:hypothetical protein
MRISLHKVDRESPGRLRKQDNQMRTFSFSQEALNKYDHASTVRDHSGVLLFLPRIETPRRLAREKLLTKDERWGVGILDTRIPYSLGYGIMRSQFRGRIDIALIAFSFVAHTSPRSY